MTRSPDIPNAPAEADSSAARSRRNRIWLDVLVVLLAIAAGFAGFALAARASVDVGPVRIAARVGFAFPGRTVIQVPPLGRLEARTHRGPARLVLMLEDVDVSGVRRALASRNLSGATRPRGVPAALTWLLLTGAAGAVAAGFVVASLARRRWPVLIVATALALVMPLASAGLAAATYDRTALEEPRLTGALAYVPGLADTFSARVASIEKLRDQAEKVARDLSAYYADTREIASGGALTGTFRVLHVTDLHLDPVGAELERQLARSYDASLVIDTGDLPILGVAEENSAYASLIASSPPRIYIPGNHDSAVSLDAIAAIPGVTVLENRIIEVDGLRVFGVPDPISRTFGNEPDLTRTDFEATTAYNRMYAAIRSGEPTPDIVAIHNPAMEKPFVGIVPLILSGHTHSARLYLTDHTVRLNSGTIGGTPYAPGRTGRKTVPYTASVLYYTARLPRRLVAIDRISVSSAGQTSVTRNVIDASLLPLAP